MSPRAEVLGCAIDRLDMTGTLDAVEQTIASGQFTQHMSINAAKLVTMHEDARMKRRSSRAAASSAPTARASCGPRGCSATRCPSASPAST